MCFASVSIHMSGDRMRDGGNRRTRSLTYCLLRFQILGLRIMDVWKVEGIWGPERLTDLSMVPSWSVVEFRLKPGPWLLSSHSKHIFVSCRNEEYKVVFPLSLSLLPGRKEKTLDVFIWSYPFIFCCCIIYLDYCSNSLNGLSASPLSHPPCCCQSDSFSVN